MKASLALLQRHYPTVNVTGRCFLLRPRKHANATPARKGASSLADALDELECVELTQNALPSSTQQRGVPGSLVGNSYYARRYQAADAARQHAPSSSISAAPRFVNGDVVLRLHRSAVPRELAHKRIVDVTGVQTSFMNSAERSGRALATVEETLQTMHLHDGHEVPALQRGIVDLVRLQPQCVYAPIPSVRGGGGVAAENSAATSFDLAHLFSALRPLDNPEVLLTQSRRLTFRSEMEALQAARVMAASVGALKNRADAGASAAPLGGVLRPVVRDGYLVAVTLRFPHDGR